MQMMSFALCLALGASACSDDGAAVEPPVCTEFSLDQTFELVQATTGTQIHLDAALGKDRLWLAYNMVGTGSDFDVFLSAISCAGKPLGAPIRVTTRTGRNNTDPVLRISKEAIFVVWSSDNHGGGASNLDIVYRTFNPDGSPRMAAEHDLETRYQGKAVTGNHWLPNAVLVDDRTLAIAGVRGIVDAPSFQTFAQRIDVDGELVGEAVSLKVESDHAHGYPDIGKDAAGRLYVGWERSKAPDYKPTLLAQARLDPAFTLLDAEPQNLLGGAQQADKPRYGRRQRVQDPQLLTFHDPLDNRIVLMDAEKPQVTPLRVGSTGQLHQGSAVSSHDGRGLLAWHQVVQGIISKTVVQGFSYDGSSFVADAEQVLSEEALPYGPTVLHVANDTYFVGWTATTSADRRALGRFIALSPR
ncbi:MAG: hypothetical protein KAI47_14830 [Deltaproteobacteria bacterium]|nr:hypothetical protein [Deltaproteobacteria bacterium]